MLDTNLNRSHDLADLGKLRINGARLWDALMRLAQIGATSKGGVCRIALTELDGQGRDFSSRRPKRLAARFELTLLATSLPGGQDDTPTNLLA